MCTRPSTTGKRSAYTGRRHASRRTNTRATLPNTKTGSGTSLVASGGREACRKRARGRHPKISRGLKSTLQSNVSDNRHRFIRSCNTSWGDRLRRFRYQNRNPSSYAVPRTAAVQTRQLGTSEVHAPTDCAQTNRAIHTRSVGEEQPTIGLSETTRTDPTTKRVYLLDRFA